LGGTYVFLFEPNRMRWLDPFVDYRDVAAGIAARLDTLVIPPLVAASGWLRARLAS
jgi:hypothetical protein